MPLSLLFLPQARRVPEEPEIRPSSMSVEEVLLWSATRRINVCYCLSHR